MHDLIIRRASIIDGTGSPARVGDIAVDRGVITEVDRVSGSAKREIDADGLTATPGFIDIHTHFDGQAIWDSELAPSSWHGVTTAVFGNCGVGFAPVRAADARYLIDLMEGVEDIPGSVLSEGLDFDWETLPQYFDALERRPHTIDIATQVPHSPLRLYVMGERGADHLNVPGEDEIATMARLVAEGIDAGALGFSTSRSRIQKTLAGQAIPTLSAGRPELLGIALALGAMQAGVLQAVSDFNDPQAADLDSEFALLRALAERSGRPISVAVTQVDHAPQIWREILGRMADAGADGLDMRAQVAARSIGILCGYQATSNPFGSKPSYRQIAHLPLDERIAELRRPERRAAILAEQLGTNRFTRNLHESMHRMFELGGEPNYEPDPATSLAAKATALGVSAHELAYDAMLRRDGRELLYFPMQNYAAGNLDAVREMMLHPRTLAGLSDAGAHCGTLCDASVPTFMLSHWGRDRTRGELVPMETLVRMQTHDTASFVGLCDRGLIAPGYRADLNVIELDRLRLLPPVIVNDLPAGGRRLVQRAEGYRHTFCAGVETFTDGAPTGSCPGALVRGARSGPVGSLP